MVALRLVYHSLAVLYLHCLYRACVNHLAHLTPAALVKVYLRHLLTHYPQVIQIQLYTVIRASANSYLELMRQLDPAVPVVEPLVYLLGEGKRVYKTILACRTLAGYHRAHLRACPSGFKSKS